ncbi:MAG: sulfite exporter TauE/SafE family protein, partial [Pseudomonadota bacterium]
MNLLNLSIDAPDLLLLAEISLVFILAGLVKGVVGLGLPTLAMGLLVGLMAPAQAAVILVLPSLLTNLWQMWVGPALRSLVMRLWPLQLGVVVATLLVPVSLVTLDARLAGMGLGAALAVYAALGLLAVRLCAPARGEGAFSAVVGL